MDCDSLADGRKGIDLSSGAPFVLDPGIDPLLEQRHRHRAGAQHHVVEGLEVDGRRWHGWGVIPPTSYHPGGVNVCMADGSCRFVAETIDTGNLNSAEARAIGATQSPYGVWGALGSRRGGETVVVP